MKSTENLEWSRDILAFNGDSNGQKLSFPIISDVNRSISDKLGAMSCRSRAVFIVDPMHKVHVFQVYPFAIGRSITDLIETIDEVQLAKTDMAMESGAMQWAEQSENILNAQLADRPYGIV